MSEAIWTLAAVMTGIAAAYLNSPALGLMTGFLLLVAYCHLFDAGTKTSE
jgi:hypothetical protein